MDGSSSPYSAQKSMPFERRSINRFQLQLQTNIMTNVESDGYFVECVLSRDISSGGAFFYSTSKPPIGQRFSFQIFLNPQKNKESSGRGAIYVDGTIVRREGDGMAVKFDQQHTIVSRVS